jgi:hypothetical protein
VELEVQDMKVADVPLVAAKAHAAEDADPLTTSERGL